MSIKVSYNDVELFTLTDTQIQVMQYVVNSDVFEDDMKRRLQWVLNHAYEEWFQVLKKDWDPILVSRVESIPTNKEAYAQLVFSQPDYKDRHARDLEAEQLLGV